MITGTQFRGTLAPNQTQRWFTFNWPEWELVDPDEPQVVPGTFARAYDQIRIRYQPR